MLVLAIDTSTPVITAGLVRLNQPHEVVAAMEAAAALPQSGSANDGRAFRPVIDVRQLLAERTVTDAFGHAEHLMPLVRGVLDESTHTIGEISAVVVGIGPGPFTGLRVGMVTAAALGDARDIPVHGVPSHDAMARAAMGTGDFLVVTDARRREVYVSAYRENGARVYGPAVIAPAALPELVAEHGLSPEWLTGAGAGPASEALGLPVREPGGSVSESLVACAVGPLLTAAVPGPLTPLYLRRPDAAEPTAPKPVLPVEPHAPAAR